MIFPPVVVPSRREIRRSWHSSVSLTSHDRAGMHLGARRCWTPPAVPPPRPRHQVHRQLRGGLRLDRCRSHQDSCPLTAGERVRRTLGSHRARGLSRSPARPLAASPRSDPRGVRRSLQPGQAPSRTTADAATPICRLRRHRHHSSARRPRRPHPRVRTRRLIDEPPIGRPDAALHDRSATCGAFAADRVSLRTR